MEWLNFPFECLRHSHVKQNSGVHTVTHDTVERFVV